MIETRTTVLGRSVAQGATLGSQNAQFGLFLAGSCALFATLFGG
jgi:hypothetical protein